MQRAHLRVVGGHGPPFERMNRMNYSSAGVPQHPVNPVNPVQDPPYATSVVDPGLTVVPRRAQIPSPTTAATSIAVVEPASGTPTFAWL
jgi:hypothetical protein